MKEQLFNYLQQLNNDPEFGSMYEEEYRKLVAYACVVYERIAAEGRTPAEAMIKAQQFLITHPFVQPLLSLELSGK